MFKNYKVHNRTFLVNEFSNFFCCHIHEEMTRWINELMDDILMDGWIHENQNNKTVTIT